MQVLPSPFAGPFASQLVSTAVMAFAM